MRSKDYPKKLIVILAILFMIGLIFSSMVVYSSFKLAKEQEPEDFGKIKLTILPKPESAPPATGKMAFRILEKPEE